ncbi:MAG: hypothetical protein WA133_10680 [Syntrophales bacterium]
MPETEEIVINTGPLLAIIAGIGDLTFLERLYKRILVPFEVCREIEVGGSSGFGVTEFRRAGFLEKRSTKRLWILRLNKSKNPKHYFFLSPQPLFLRKR